MTAHSSAVATRSAPRGTGSIINISSRSGRVGIPAAAAYASSQAAVCNHTKPVALYCAEQGGNIRCNSSHPAAILTPIREPMLGDGPDREARMDAFVADTPMRRFGTVEEVAAIALLAGSAAAPKTDRASRNEVLAPVLVEMACPPSRTGGHAGLPSPRSGRPYRFFRKTDIMTDLTLTEDLVRKIRLAGLFYLIIILAGLGAELGLRGPLIDLSNAEGTATAILAAPGRFRLAIAADLVMALCDAGLAILLYLIFRSVAPGLALSAMVFRLIQTVLIAANLLAMQAAWLLISGSDGLADANALASMFLDLHGHGYDLGLVFFGINGLIMGALVWRSGLFARGFGVGLAIAGMVYLVGSSLRFFAPELSSAFAPAYGLTILAETAFCLRLLLQRSSR